jgi:outer membrane protein assembly factor BamD (BamD/ComL family)
VPGKKAASTVNAPSARLPVAAVAPGAAGRDTEEPRPPEHVATLEVELALMRRAHAALNDGDAEEALAALDEHARNFPSGALAEDRAAQRVLALCALGQTDLAREEGERFIADYSRSPHVAVVRGSCAFIAEPRR